MMLTLRPALRILMTLVCLCSCACFGAASAGELDIEAAVRRLARPVPDGEPLLWQDADLTWLDRYGETRLLAFGEASHGTHEFTTARQRTFRYLVERHGYRVLALEAHFTETMFLEQCLADAECDLADAMNEYMLVWTTRTREMLGVLEWVREHNLGLPTGERVYVVGYDAQVRRRVEELLHRLLGPLDAAWGAAVDEAFAPLADLGRGDYQEMDDETAAGHRRRLEDLAERMEGSDIEAELGRHRASCVLQTIHTAAQSLEFLQQYFHAGRNVRDRHLQENVAWIARLFGEETKVVLWAHNAHVARHHGYASEAGGNMGWQLSRTWGDDYRTIGLTFNRGEFRAKVFDADGEVTEQPRLVVFAVDPPSDSFNRLLDAPAARRFVLPLLDIDTNSPLGEWFAGERAVLGVGDLFLGYEKIGEYHYGGDRVLEPLRAFDAILHLEGTRPTTGLSTQ